MTTAEIGVGQPIFRFHPRTGEAWLARHDTIVRLSPDWTVRDAVRIRPTVRGEVISDLAFDSTGERVAIAFSERRPVPMLQPYRLPLLHALTQGKTCRPTGWRRTAGLPPPQDPTFV